MFSLADIHRPKISYLYNRKHQGCTV